MKHILLGKNKAITAYYAAKTADRRMAEKFLERVPFAENNTSFDGRVLTLHGNRIAWWNPDGSLSLTLAGYATVTTRSRLNAITMEFNDTRPFMQRGKTQFFDKREIGLREVITFHDIHT